MSKNGIPSVSVFRFLSRAGQILKNPLPFHHENFEKLGAIFRVNLGFGKSMIFSRDAKLAQYVLQKNHKNYHKSEIQTKELAKYVGKGLLTSEGDHWKKQRKLLQPTFHKKQLVQLLTAIQKAITAELDKITTNAPIDVFPIFNDLAFQTVVKSLFSSAANQKDINRLQYITESAQRMLVKELRQPFKKWWFHLSGELARNKDLTLEARDILKKLVQDRKESKERKGDLLDMLLEARYEDGNGMDAEQLIDEILIIFTAGHETTSNALTFTCELLARHSEVQEKVATEVRSARAQSTSLMEFIKSCSYTKQVIEESMRLYPPVYFIDRVNFEEDTFENLVIPKGSNLLFSLFEIHRSKEFWQEPEKFDPDRFAEGKALQYSAYYYPFGAGPRMCIGNNFAMYEMILATAEVVEKFKISAKTENIKIKPLITLKPEEAFLEFNLR
ncbi:cytochrome P450 [Gillisia sp. M10.2A]|uniref:Cytochrome P450 n=1 Tax=Gillisia lutea TaxID=2909668 RepID=A0ABS9EBB9_9FLAO|nr:cytochrome P450 [Gillisia lutea]MCF4100181.1 cytochrome P450 [Gillisia lutea]